MNDLSKARATLLEVGEEGVAQRIDNFLLRRLKGVPKSHVYRVLRSGQVRVNSARVKPDYRLRSGDRVRIPPVRVAAAVARPLPARLPELPVVYEDDALLVIDKPSGVAVHGASGLSFGVIEALRAARPAARLHKLAHRLDRETSGVIVLAKDRPTLLELHALLRDEQAHKTYQALVRGSFAERPLVVDAQLEKNLMRGGERLVGVHQVHSALAVRALAPFPGPRPQADALVTTVPGLAISVLTADCAPVLLADPHARVIGAAHSGWKGALSGVLEAFVDAIEGRTPFPVSDADMLATVGTFEAVVRALETAETVTLA